MNTTMSALEKKTLRQNILELPPHALNGVWEILKKENEYNGKELRFDIDSLSTKKARELE